MRALLPWLTLLAGCLGGGEATKGVRIGALLSTTGDLAGIGTDMLRAAHLAALDVSNAGGPRLAIEPFDDQSSAEVAAIQGRAMVDAGIQAAVGGVGSASTLAAAEIAAPASVVMVSPSSTSPVITDLADGGFLFRTCPSDALQGILMAQRALDRGLRSAAIIFVPGPYGEGMADSFEAAFSAGGGEITARVEYIENQPSYVDMLDGVLADDPDVIVMPAYPVDGGRMIADYNTNFATETVTFLFADALANQDFLDAAGSFGFPHEGTAPSFVGPEHEAFANAYSARYGQAPTAFLSNAYDATFLIALALAAAGNEDGAAIRDAMTAVSVGGTAYGADEAKALFEAIRDGEDVDYQGASGPVDLDANGDIVAPYDIWVVDEDGAITVTTPAVLPAR